MYWKLIEPGRLQLMTESNREIARLYRNSNNVWYLDTSFAPCTEIVGHISNNPIAYPETLKAVTRASVVFAKMLSKLTFDILVVAERPTILK